MPINRLTNHGSVNIKKIARCCTSCSMHENFEIQKNWKWKKRSIWFSTLFFHKEWRCKKYSQEFNKPRMPAVRTYSLWEFRHAQGSACISLAHTAFRANNDDEDFAMSVILWERRSILTLNYLLLVVLGCLASVSNQCIENSECKNGYCRAGMCICNPGWWGSLCQFCRLRWENRLFRSSSLTQLRHVNYVLLEIARYQT